MAKRRRLTREESRQQTRQRLIDAAARVFADRGYHGASLDEIAESAGYSRGAVYSNYAGKDELFLALLDRVLEEGAEPWWRTLDVAGAARDFRSELLDHRAQYLAQAEFALQAAREPDVGRAFAARARRSRADLAASLAAGYAERGEEPPMPVEDLARIISALATGLAVEALVDPDEVPSALYETALTRLLGGDSA